MLCSKKFEHPPSNFYSVQVQPTIELPKKPKPNTCTTVESSHFKFSKRYWPWNTYLDLCPSDQPPSIHPSNLICDRAVVFYQLCCCLANHHRCVTTASVLSFICTVVSSLLVPARWSLSRLYSSDTRSCTVSDHDLSLACLSRGTEFSFLPPGPRQHDEIIRIMTLLQYTYKTHWQHKTKVHQCY